MSERAQSQAAEKMIDSLKRNYPVQSQELLPYLPLVEQLLSQGSYNKYATKASSPAEKLLSNLERDIERLYSLSDQSALPEFEFVSKGLKFLLSPCEEQSEHLKLKFPRYPDFVYMPAKLLTAAEMM
mmetsp:Transcript_9397/g.18053  ORF Transcript_9397/g.18053 Transcript_9397/m.18053 type:complete len:127 (-) Transcript_9397:10-390(-)